VAADGPCGRLLRPHEDDPFGSALVLRFLGAVHWLVLAGRAPDLARHYPTAGGTPGPTLAADFLAAVEDLSGEVAARLPLPVQTNEVGRCAALVGGYVEAARRAGGRPLRVFEVGASAGLNLNWDRYRYDTGETTFGDPSSPLRFVGRWAGAPPRLDGGPVVVAERAGCDRSPIDAATEEGRRLVRSYVWPDQAARHARLDAALAVAAGHPVAVERADLGDWLTARLAVPAPGACTVVVHSIVWQYVGEASRRAMRAALAAAGAAATPDAPLAWLRMEPAGAVADVRLTWWSGGGDAAGTEEVLGHAEYQGDTVWWGPDRPEGT
jgi:hypothetical protein